MPGTGCTVSARTDATTVAAMTATAGTRSRQKEQQSRCGGDQDHELLRVLAAEPDRQQQARPERADDGAERVGRVDPADQPRRILVARGHRGQGQRKARAPEDRARQHGEQARASDRAGTETRSRSTIDGLTGQYGSDSVSDVRRSTPWRRTAPADTRPARCAAARGSGPVAAPTLLPMPEAGQEHRQNQRERVGRRADAGATASASRAPRQASAVNPDSAITT